MIIPPRAAKLAALALSITLSITLAVTACVDADDTSTADPASPTTELAEDTATEDIAAEDTSTENSSAEGVDRAALTDSLVLLDEAYRRIDGAWQGFQPTEHPVVLAWKNGGDVLAAVAINHPNPDALGRAEQIDHGGSHLGPVHLIDNLETSAADVLGPLVNFEFDTEVGGASSFLMEANTADEFFNPTALDYGSTLIHEMFHRYQGLNPQAFDGDGFQDVDGYAYTADNIEMAVLEDRALLAGLAADSDDERDNAARHVAAIRMARLQADPRVILDQDQELAEGSARYLEHLLGQDDTSYTYHSGNFGRELSQSPAEAFGVKDTYGFGRFYASGAAMYHLLAQAGSQPDALTEQSGTPPAQLLAETLGVDEANVAQLVADAKAAYDPDGELPGLAAEAEATAADEPSPFAEESGDPAADAAADGSEEFIEVTAEQADCLDRELGIEDTEDPDDTEDPEAGENGVSIPDEVWELCVGDG